MTNPAPSTSAPGLSALAGITSLLPATGPYGRLGGSLGAINPIAGIAGYAIGTVADQVVQGQNMRKQFGADQHADNRALWDANMQGSGPYAGAGYGQIDNTGLGWAAPTTTPGMAKGGRVMAPPATAAPTSDTSATGQRRKQMREERADPADREVGHVVPADRRQLVQADATRAGMDLRNPATPSRSGVVRGPGTTTSDSVPFRPQGGPPLRLSAGELFLGQDDFGALARAAGMTTAQYADRIHPNGSTATTGKAAGGGVPPEGEGFNFMQTAMGDRAALYGGGPYEQDPRLQDMSKVLGDLIQNPVGSEQLQTQGQMKSTAAQPPTAMAPQAPSSAGLQTPLPPGQPKAATGQNVDPYDDPATGDGSPTLADLQGMNDRSAILQAIPALGATAYNLFSRRTALPAPHEYTPQRVDLKTEALSAKLDADRQRGVATAVYNTRDEQGVGRDLGIVANDLQARRDNTMAVQGVKNQENQENTQIANQAALYNTGTKNQWQMGDAQANDQFRAMKGQAVSQNLAALTGIVGAHAQNRIDLGAQEQLKKYQDRYLSYLSGAWNTRNWTPTYVQTGNPADQQP